MLSSALSSLEAKAWPSENPQDNCDWREQLSLLINNHTLPIFMELQFEDIVFGIFPLVGAEMLYLFGYWSNNSVGDIIDMLKQMLKVSKFYFRYVVSQYLSIYLKALEYCPSSGSYKHINPAYQS